MSAGTWLFEDKLPKATARQGHGVELVGEELRPQVSIVSIMTKISHGAYRFRPGTILAALQGCIRTPFVRLPAYGERLLAASIGGQSTSSPSASREP